MSANLYALFGQRFPDNLGNTFLAGPGTSDVSYGDVERRSAQFVNLLLAHGVTSGDRVAVQVEKSADALLLYLGCLRAGAVFLPLNTAYTGEELDFFLGDATPRLVVCDSAREADMQRRAKAHDVATCLTLDADGSGSAATQAAAHDHQVDTASSSPNDLAAILYSSGTTGKPKGVMLSHGALTTNALALQKVWQFSKSDVLLHALPIFHTHGLFVATNTVLMNGTGMIFHPRFEPRAVIEDLSKATVFMGVPTYYTRLLGEAALTPQACQSIRLFISGSAPLLEDTFRQFAQRTGRDIVERYGMTEAGIITSADPDKPRKAGTVGWPVEGVSLRIADDSDAPVPDGTTGNVHIKGSSLFSGYWNKPDKTAEDFTADGYFRTGDIGLREPDGQLTLVGRAKDMFISGGFNVFPKEIEQAIDAMAGVTECAVIGMPHPDFGEAGLAVIVATESETLDPDRIRKDLKANLANYKVPKHVVQADSLPRNAMGKVQKNLLRESFRAQWEAWLQAS